MARKASCLRKLKGWVGRESGAALIRKAQRFCSGGALMTPKTVRTSSPYVLRNLEMMSIKGTSQTQRMKWTPTLTLTKGMNHPVMEKQKSPGGSAE